MGKEVAQKRKNYLEWRQAIYLIKSPSNDYRKVKKSEVEWMNIVRNLINYYEIFKKLEQR